MNAIANIQKPIKNINSSTKKAHTEVSNKWLGLTREKVLQQYQFIIPKNAEPHNKTIVQFGQLDYLPWLNLLLKYKQYQCVAVTVIHK